MRDKWIICKILELNLIINQIRQLDNYKISIKIHNKS